MKRVKSRWETTQRSLPVEVYLQWLEQREAVHSYDTITSTHTHTYRSVLSRPLQIWHIFKVSMKRRKTKQKNKTSEVENVMVHAPYHLAYMVECAFVKVPWSSFIQGGWFSASAGVQFGFSNVPTFERSLRILLIAPFEAPTTTTTTLTNRWRREQQSAGSHFAPSPCVIKISLSLLCQVLGVSASCRHAVSHFKPVMTILGAWADTCGYQVACCLPSDTPEIKGQSV